MPIGRLPFLGGGGGGGSSDGSSTLTVITGSTEVPSTQSVVWGSLTEEQQQTAIDAGVTPPENPEDEVDIPVVFGTGLAVCLAQNEDGQEVYRLCSSNLEFGSPNTFLGFQINDTSNGAAPIVVTMRGTRVSDVSVAYDEDLVPGEDVYLSHVVGRVTQNPTNADGHVDLRVGFAVGPKEIILSNDFRIHL